MEEEEEGDAEEEEEEEEFGKTTKERPLPHIVKYHGKVQHSFAIPLY